MNAREIIEGKRDGRSLEPDGLRSFLTAYLDGRVTDYQMAAFLMAVHFQGLNGEETDVMVDAMLGSGTTLDLSDLPAPKVDKHSTGGVGDKVSLALVPLAACAGMCVPMISGRGLGHTTGTLDKLEAIPGFRTDLSLERFRAVLGRIGCAMVGQSEEIAPLDRRLYALRDVTGTVPSLPLIVASIMSKKLAEGLEGLVLDVKVGAGAFLPDERQAIELARSMVRVGTARGVRTVALLTAMDRPLGRAVGNGLETAEAVRCLRGEGPEDLRSLVVLEVAEMLRAGGLDAADSAEERISGLLESGAALERFARLVEMQGGDPRVVDDPDLLHTAPQRREVEADVEGFVAKVEPRTLGDCVVGLGGGRQRMDQEIDPGVGFEIDVGPGDAVRVGQRLGVVHARDPAGLDLGERALREAVLLSEEASAAAPLPLVCRRISAEDV